MNILGHFFAREWTCQHGQRAGLWSARLAAAPADVRTGRRETETTG